MNLKKTQETFKKKTSFQVPVTIIIISCATNDRILVTVFFIFFSCLYFTPPRRGILLTGLGKTNSEDMCANMVIIVLFLCSCTGMNKKKNHRQGK